MDAPALRNAMEDDLDREWTPVLNGGSIVIQHTCPRCGAGVVPFGDSIQRHKDWHRQLGH